MAESTTWRDQLRDGKFRGVEFQCLEDERPVGREVAEHKFVLRNGSKGEDLGEVTKWHRLTVFIQGPDYMARRDAFEAVLAKPGIGELIVPWIGTVQARLMPGGRVRETDDEGGIARYQLEFMEESDDLPLQQSDDTQAQAATSADAVHTVAVADVSGSFSVAGKPAFVADAAAAIVSKLSDQFDSLVAPLKGEADKLNRWVAQGLALRTSIVSLVTKPADLASQISGIIQGIRTVAATPADALTALKSLFGFGSGFQTVSTATPARRAQAANQSLLVGLVQQSAAAEAVKALTETDFVAYQDAVSARDTMSDVLEDIATAAADAERDDTWRAIEDVRLAMVRDINARGASLARLYAYTPASTVPAIVLAHSLYDNVGDIEMNASDICDRNDIYHPGFVPGGQVLEVLSDV